MKHTTTVFASIIIIFGIFSQGICRQDAAVQITEDPATDIGPEWSPDGKSISFCSDRTGSWEVYVVPATGGEQTPITDIKAFAHVSSWSKDGSELVFAANVGSDNFEIWKISLDDRKQIQLTEDPAIDGWPHWSREGSLIAFPSNRGGNWDIWTIRADGEGEPERITSDPGYDHTPSFSPDGSKIAFTSSRGGSNDIWIISLKDKKLTQLTAGSAKEFAPCWSPDGKMIAYQSSTSGNNEIWAVSSSGGEPKQITFDPASDQRPSWSPDGSKIVFCSDRNGNLDLWVIDISDKGIESENSPILHELAVEGDLNKIKELVENDPELIDQKSKDGSTPLITASFCGFPNIVEYLLEKGADPTTKDNDGRTSLHYAASTGNIKIMELLVKGNADLNAVEDSEGFSLVHLAAEAGNGEILDYLASKKMDFNTKDNGNRTPLMLAVENFMPGILPKLLELGADPSIININDGGTPLHFAASRSSRVMVDALVSNGVDVDVPGGDGYTALHWTAFGGNSEMAEYLLELGADPKRKGDSGLTPLHSAAYRGRENVIDLLLSKSFEIDPGDDSGMTPLAMAAQNGNPGSVKLLFEKGADINAVNNSGMSILHFSLVSEKFDIAEYLINNGADVDHTDSSGRSSLFWAALRGKSEIVKSLLDKGADAAVSDNGGTTPLHPAVQNGHFEIVKLLVEKGADVNAHNRSNDTILDVAVTYEKTDIADYIRTRGGVSTQLEEPLVKAVSGNYYRISFPYSLRTNTGVSAGRDGILLIDPAEKRTVQKLKEETQKINDGAFRFLVNTHPHGDHTSGNNIADERTVLINFESLERLVSDKIISIGNGRVTGKTGEGFERYYTLDFNEEEIRIIPNPGLHSNDDIMIWFSGSGVVHMGDILLSESFPSIDNVEGYLEFLDVVLDVYPEETIFVSGHGKDLDHNGVKDYQDMLKTTVEIITEEMKKGKSVEEIKEDRVLRDYESYSIFLDFLNTNTWIETVYRSYRDRF